METEIISAAEVRELLAVSQRTLRGWRLSKNPRLPSVTEPTKHKTRGAYRLADVVRFCHENPRYGDRVLRAFAYGRLHEKAQMPIPRETLTAIAMALGVLDEERQAPDAVLAAQYLIAA